MSNYGYNPESGKYLMPAYEVQTEDDTITLTWLNTIVRTFIEEEYNHVEYRPEDSVYGLRMSADAMNELLEMDYPYRFDPIVDESTARWIGNILIKEIELD